MNRIFKNRINSGYSPLAAIGLGCLLVLTYIVMPQTVSGSSPGDFKGDGKTNSAAAGAQGVALSRIVFVRQQRGGVGASDILIMDSDGTNQRLLTTVQMLRSAPSISKDGTKVVFTQFVNTGENIYVINTNGTIPMPVTNYQSKLMTSPNWSFDGSKITFAGNIDINNSTLAAYEIYSMNANGTGVTRLTTNSVEDNYPFWSPDGSKIVYSHSEGNLSGLYVMNANGSNSARILTGTNRNSEWSPTGAKIAFDRIDGFDLVYTVNSGDGSAMTLIAGGTTLTRDKQPTWSPDGDRIAWSTQNNDVNSSLQISTMNPDGTNKTPLTNNQTYDYTNPSWGAAAAAPLRSPFDFDGDNKTDVAIHRPSPGEWWYFGSGSSQNAAFQFGSSSDKIAPADFTGDGKTDIAYFRPSTGEWFILRSENGSYYSFPFGTTGDIPAPADFDGDGKADPTVFRPSNNTWYTLRSTGGVTIQTFGQNGDIPVVADYDGDGKADVAIWRPLVGEWWYLKSSNGANAAFQFGNSSDKPVQGDYTGDGRTDIAFWRPSTGEWFVLRSQDNSYYSVPFGTSGDIPAPGDYDGDGRFDTAVFRSSDSNWYVQRSTAGILIQRFGQIGDRPVPNAFVP